MTEEEIKQYAHEYAEKQIKHRMAVHDIFDKEQATEEIEQAFIEGADFMYYSNNEELKNQLTEKDKQIVELKAQIEKMKCCEMCKHKNLNWGFSPICEARDNIKIENPLTCKCDKWEIKEND